MLRPIFLSLFFAVTGVFAGSAGPAFLGVKAIQSQAYGRVATILEIHGERGDPLPAEWVFLLADPTARGGVREVTVVDGRITGERTPLKGASEVSSLAPVDPAMLKSDADAAFRAAHVEAEKNELGFDWLDYTLRTDPESRAPVWSVKLYDHMGAPVGMAKISAKSGFAVGALRTDPDARSRAAATPTSRSGGVIGGVGNSAGHAAKSAQDSALRFLGTIQETFVGERTIGPKEEE